MGRLRRLHRPATVCRVREAGWAGASRRRDLSSRSARSGSGLVWVLAVVLVVAAYGSYHLWIASTGPTGAGCSSACHVLVVDTYPSFFSSGSDPGAARAELFGAFEKATGSRVLVNYVPTDLSSTLLASSPDQLPDVVVGLDEITAPRLDAAGMLLPYQPEGLVDVPAPLDRAIAPDHTVTPYEYGYLGLDYNTSFDAAAEHAFSRGDYLTAIQANASLARAFLYENPTTDIVGEELLVMQIEFYSHILHQDWTTLWRSIGSIAGNTPGWSDCFNQFSSGASPTCLSFTTDPAYNAYFEYPGGTNSTVLHEAGLNYSWETIYGAAIVRGGVHNLTLAERFVDWLLSGTIQQLVPTNEWEYPANRTIGLPSAYDWAVPPASIVALNGFDTPEVIAAQLPGWLLSWQEAV